MSRPRAVIFDLWQTLVVWPHEASLELYRQMAARLGADEERFRTLWLAGREQRDNGPVRESMLAVARELGAEDAVDELLRMRLDYHRRHLVPRPDALPTLEALREAGYALGLISVCSQEVEQLWDETDLAPHFDAVVLSCSVGVSKPHPRIYEIACDRLGVAPPDCVFVGDGANHELPGAERVGMRAIQLRVPAEALTPEGEEWEGEFVRALAELPAVLAR